MDNKTWISVEERLPVDTMDVLVTDGCSIEKARGHPDDYGVVWMLQSPFCTMGEDTITHWMPLPELPK